MVKILYITTFVIVCQIHAIAQCNEKGMDNLYDETVNDLKTFEYSDVFKINQGMFTYGGEKVEFKKNFYKGTTYLIILKDRSADHHKMMVEIFDSSKRLVATSHNKHNGKFYHKIYFPCKATGSYYLKYSFYNSDPTCGTSVVGFKTTETKKKEIK